MKAVGITHYRSVNEDSIFVDLNLPKPEAKGRDLVVAAKAVSVNPVDTKVRKGGGDKVETPPRILGWDASGGVEVVGPEVTLFKPGDEVYYAGDITRSGSNAEYQLVDERIVGVKPNSLNFAEAAALPLTSITAYEAFFDRLGIDRDSGDTHHPMPMAGIKTKAASLHWEFMFARAMQQTPDMIEQHKLLTYVAGEIDAGRIRTTLETVVGSITVANLLRAHKLIGTGTAKDKVVLEGFE